MVRLKEISTSLLINPLESKTLVSSLPLQPPKSSNKFRYHPSNDTFPSSLDEELTFNHVVDTHKEWTPREDVRRGKHEKRGEKMAARTVQLQQHGRHGNSLRQHGDSGSNLQHHVEKGRVIKVKQTSPTGGGRLVRHRRREVTCLTAAWCHQQPFGREVAREVRRIYGIPRRAAVLGWLLTGGELYCRAVLWLLYKLPQPTVAYKIFRGLDEVTCSGLQWVEGTRQVTRRGEQWPMWRRMVGTLLAAGVAPPAVLWGRWLSRQQRLFLQEAGVPCPPSEASQWGLLGTSADILMEILAEISAAFVGREGSTEDLNSAVAREPALDTVTEEDEEGFDENIDQDTDDEDVTIPLWELCWPDEEVLKEENKRGKSNEDSMLNISKDMHGVCMTNSKEKDKRVVSKKCRSAADAQDKSHLSSQYSKKDSAADVSLAFASGRFPNCPPSPHPTPQSLPWPNDVEGPIFHDQGQDNARNMLLHFYCSLWKMMFLILMLMRTMLKSEFHHGENDHPSRFSFRPVHGRRHSETESDGVSSSSARRVHTRDYKENDYRSTSEHRSSSSAERAHARDYSENDFRSVPEHRSSSSAERAHVGDYSENHYRSVSEHRSSSSAWPIYDQGNNEMNTRDVPNLYQHNEGQYIERQPQLSKRKTNASVQSRRVSLSSCSSSDDAEEKETCMIEAERFSTERAYVPLKKKVQMGGRKVRRMIDKKVSRKDQDFIEPGLSDYEEEMWLQLGITPQEVKKEDEETDTELEQYEDFEAWLNGESEEIFENIPDDVGTTQNISGGAETRISVESTDSQVAARVSCDNKNISIKLSDQLGNEQHSDEDASQQNIDWVSEKPPLNRSSTYILQTTFDDFDSTVSSSEKDMKAVKDQTNSKMRTEALNTDVGVEVLSMDVRTTAETSNCSDDMGTVPPKDFHKGARIGKPVARKHHTESGLSIKPKPDVSSPKNSPSKVSRIVNADRKKKNASKPLQNNVTISGMHRHGVVTANLNLRAAGKPVHCPTKKRINGTTADKKLSKDKILGKNKSPDAQIDSNIDQQKDHKPWRSCCMNSRNLNEETCCTNSKRKCNTSKQNSCSVLKQ